MDTTELSLKNLELLVAENEEYLNRVLVDEVQPLLGCTDITIVALGTALAAQAVYGFIPHWVDPEAERIPFDAPIAETEIVGGWETEYSGKKLAFFRLSNDFEVLLAAALGAAIFLGGPLGPEIFAVFINNGLWAHVTIASGEYLIYIQQFMPWLLNPFIAGVYYTFWFIVKTTILVLILSNMKALFARWRIANLVAFTLKVVLD